MNKKKAEAYEKLLKETKDLYIVPLRIGKIELENGWEKLGGCKEINLYTYWQGLEYIKSTPSIKYLLVAQDWGCLEKASEGFIERIKKINKGHTDKPYIKNDEKNFPTDENLIILFKELGYGSHNPSIAEKRYVELFFTNFCLGYRKNKSSNGMPKEAMEHDAKYFRRLCEILEPENILCLGKMTFVSVYESLMNEKESKPKNFNKGYNYFIEHHDKIIAKCGNVESKIYPLAHCGILGTMNRNKNSDKEKLSLDRQIEDWRRIAKDNRER